MFSRILKGVVVVATALSFLLGCMENDAATAASPPQPEKCPYRFVSWNTKEMGAKKSEKALRIMTEVLWSADVIALQEVVHGKGFGARAVADLAGRLGGDWDYVISDPTMPRTRSVERYAFLIRKHVQFSRRDAVLLEHLAVPIEREPYSLQAHLPQVGLVHFLSFHAVPTAKDPSREIAALITDQTVREAPRLLISGDFNLPGRITDRSFEPLGLTGHIREKTTLKEALDPNGNYLHHQLDNIYTRGVVVCEAGTIDFVKTFYSPVTDASLTLARKEVSDHLPIFVRFGTH